jgi:hypothetical protein
MDFPLAKWLISTNTVMKPLTLRKWQLIDENVRHIGEEIVG